VIRKEVPFKELVPLDFGFTFLPLLLFASWGFDTEKPINWFDDLDRDVRIYTQRGEGNGSTDS
jgi:hypothetical protein